VSHTQPVNLSQLADLKNPAISAKTTAAGNKKNTATNDNKINFADFTIFI
jgi:hypothetical protein